MLLYNTGGIRYIYNNYLTKEETAQLQTKDSDKVGAKFPT